jgi:NADPH-dependent glutamate synthase beta subunit-like oxidoreductase
MKLGLPDESGRPRPVPIEGSEFTTEYDAVMSAIGENPDTSILTPEFLNDKGQVKMEPGTGFLEGNIFAGGDFATGQPL